jgi:hypothetical protein
MTIWICGGAVASLAGLNFALAMESKPNSPQSVDLARPTAVSFDLPLAASEWNSLQFKKIKANEVEFGEGALKVKVRTSASPLIHALPKPVRVQAVRVHGSWEDLKSPERPAKEFDEDSLLRVGLVIPGRLTLSGPKRWLAAEWVKRLFDLAPKGSGIDRIDFLMFTSREPWIGRDRVHPSSELIRERKMSLRPKPGDFETLWKLPEPLQVAAIWLSVDGDDGAASFDLRITKLQLVIEEE